MFSIHSAVFQTCRSHDDFCLRQLKVRRGQERTFQLTESASTIMSCLPFTKPRSRGSPSRISNAFKKIAECVSCSACHRMECVFAIDSFGVKIDIIGTFLYQAPPSCTEMIPSGAKAQFSMVCLLLNPDLVGVLLVFQMLSRKLQNVYRV
jgi:hypothetical protein